MCIRTEQDDRVLVDKFGATSSDLLVTAKEKNRTMSDSEEELDPRIVVSFEKMTNLSGVLLQVTYSSPRSAKTTIWA